MGSWVGDSENIQCNSSNASKHLKCLICRIFSNTSEHGIVDSDIEGLLEHLGDTSSKQANENDSVSNLRETDGAAWKITIVHCLAQEWTVYKYI